MNAIEQRLIELRKNLKAETDDPDGSELYIQDLKDSINQCEFLLEQFILYGSDKE